MNLSIQFPLLAGCIPTDRDLTVLAGIAGVDVAMVALGGWMLTKGWKTRSRDQGKAYLVLGGVVTAVFVIPWIIVLLSFIPR